MCFIMYHARRKFKNRFVASISDMQSMLVSFSSTYKIFCNSVSSDLQLNFSLTSCQIINPIHFIFTRTHLSCQSPPTYLCFHVTAAAAESAQCSAPQGCDTGLELWRSRAFAEGHHSAPALTP